MKNKKYHTVGTITKSRKKKYHTVETIIKSRASRVVTMVTTGWDNRRIVVTIRWKFLVVIKS
jgi:hypothetical protein